MRRKLRTKRGRAEYDKRKVTVEPVFGQMKGRQGFREFLLRGHRKVQGEWSLRCTAHKLLKLFSSGWKPTESGLAGSYAGPLTPCTAPVAV